MQGSVLAAGFSCYVPAQPETRTKLSSRNKIKPSPNTLSKTGLTTQFISDTVKKRLQEERNEGWFFSSNVLRDGFAEVSGRHQSPADPQLWWRCDLGWRGFICTEVSCKHTFVVSINVGGTFLFIAFLCSSPPFHSLNPSFISFLFLSCPVFIPLFSSAPYSHIPSMSSQLLLDLTILLISPPLLHHLS